MVKVGDSILNLLELRDLCLIHTPPATDTGRMTVYLTNYLLCIVLSTNATFISVHGSSLTCSLSPTEVKHKVVFKVALAFVYITCKQMLSGEFHALEKRHTSIPFHSLEI